MNIKNLKFLIGGLVLAVFATVIVFAASPSHAQADENTDNAMEMVSNQSEMGDELSSETKDCSQKCTENKECKSLCIPGCTVAPCEK